MKWKGAPPRFTYTGDPLTKSSRQVRNRHYALGMGGKSGRTLACFSCRGTPLTKSSRHMRNSGETMQIQ